MGKYQKLLESSESEVIEFKAATKSFKAHEVGKYFSALSNEARLAKKPEAWLILGVNDPQKFRDSDNYIVGTHYKNDIESMNKLKYEVSKEINNSLSFTEVTEKFFAGKRVLFFGIPACLPNTPTTYQNVSYGRTGESVDVLSPLEIRGIINQFDKDWSKEIVDEATIADLNPEAINLARLKFKEKNPRLVEEVDKWDDLTFLNKSKITINGKITNAAILLLGNSESSVYLQNGQARISWILQDSNGIPQDYEHFGPPYILMLDEARGKIRNLNYRYMRENTIFPTEIRQYDSFVLREAINNAVAHQNYEYNGKINILEQPNRIKISNLGEFLPGSVEAVVQSDQPSDFYRNPFLAEAMVTLNLIDTIGSGIKKMITTQIDRTFPLPSYNFNTSERNYPRVEVTIYGEIIDINYSEALLKYTNLSLQSIMLLDKVQKKEQITKKEADLLRKQKLIEGRYPNIHVTSAVAKVTNTESDYLDNKGLDDFHYQELIMNYLTTYPKAKKKEIFLYLKDKLPGILDEKQKLRKTEYLLTKLSKAGKIRSEGNSSKAVWAKN